MFFWLRIRRFQHSKSWLAKPLWGSILRPFMIINKKEKNKSSNIFGLMINSESGTLQFVSLQFDFSHFPWKTGIISASFMYCHDYFSNMGESFTKLIAWVESLARLIEWVSPYSMSLSLSSIWRSWYQYSIFSHDDACFQQKTWLLSLKVTFMLSSPASEPRLPTVLTMPRERSSLGMETVHLTRPLSVLIYYLLTFPPPRMRNWFHQDHNMRTSLLFSNCENWSTLSEYSNQVVVSIYTV